MDIVLNIATIVLNMTTKWIEIVADCYNYVTNSGTNTIDTGSISYYIRIMGQYVKLYKFKWVIIDNRLSKHICNFIGVSELDDSYQLKMRTLKTYTWIEISKAEYETLLIFGTLKVTPAEYDE